MMKKTLTALLVVASMSLLTTPLSAHGKRCCSGPKSAAESMKPCRSCPHKAAMADGYTALRKDLAVMEKGIAKADMKAFLKTHQVHLEKVLEAHRACMKDCPATKAAMDTGCPYAEAVQSAFNALSKDEAMLKKGVPEAEEASFLKTHESNLKKLLDTKAKCTKKCPVKGSHSAAEKV